MAKGGNALFTSVRAKRSIGRFGLQADMRRCGIQIRPCKPLRRDPDGRSQPRSRPEGLGPNL